MNGSITLSVFEIVGSQLCVASDDGQKVYERLAAAIKEGRNVVVSFLNVASLTSAFLNAAIGQLYGSFTEEQIRAKVRVQDMAGDDLALLKRVVDTSKEYFRDMSAFKAATQEMLGGDDE
jgi:hypothetical protein